MARGRRKSKTFEASGLKALREIDLGNISRAELAKKLRISESTLTSYERGLRYPQGERLLALAADFHSLGVPVTRLIRPGGFAPDFLRSAINSGEISPDTMRDFDSGFEHDKQC